MLLSFPATYLCETEFSNQNNIPGAEPDMRTQLSSIKLYFKELCRTVHNATLLTNFLLLKILEVFFFITMLVMLTCNGFINLNELINTF